MAARVHHRDVHLDHVHVLDRSLAEESILEDELVKGINGQYASAQETADAIAAAWEKITDQIEPGEPDRALQGVARHVAPRWFLRTLGSAGGAYFTSPADLFRQGCSLMLQRR